MADNSYLQDITFKFTNIPWSVSPKHLRDILQECLRCNLHTQQVEALLDKVELSQ